MPTAHFRNHWEDEVGGQRSCRFLDSVAQFDPLLFIPVWHDQADQAAQQLANDPRCTRTASLSSSVSLVRSRALPPRQGWSELPWG